MQANELTIEEVLILLDADNTQLSFYSAQVIRHLKARNDNLTKFAGGVVRHAEKSCDDYLAGYAKKSISMNELFTINSFTGEIN